MLATIFNFLDNITTNSTSNIQLEDITIGVCSDETLFIFQMARFVIRIIQIAVPFALIIWGSLDFFKAVVAGDEKEMKQKRKPFVQRLIAAIVIIVLPIIATVILNNVGDTEQKTTFSDCWTRSAEGASGLFQIPKFNQ